MSYESWVLIFLNFHDKVVAIELYLYTSNTPLCVGLTMDWHIIKKLE